MNEKLENITVETAEKLQQWLETTEGFVAEQAPLVAQEIVAWQYYRGVVHLFPWLIVATVLLVASALFFLNSRKVEDSEVRCGFQVMSAVTLVFSLFTLVPIVLDGLKPMVYATVAPRLVVLNYIKAFL